MLVHRCNGCDVVHLNRIAGDDYPLALMHLAVRPLAQPPFPLEWLICSQAHQQQPARADAE
ncbi:MAG: hypothetical protein QOG56_1221 [Solirubrobacteraceae bacterium]|nr:hypothetical protein [Solirubrobacteraceae bacterium]